MVDPTDWSSLRDDTLSVLKDSLRDFVDVEKEVVKTALTDIAESLAKQTWLSVRGSDDERAQAPGNIRSLKAQAIILAADTEIVAAKELRATFVKIVETAGLFLLKNAPKLLALI
jgi:hypothetical protein